MRALLTLGVGVCLVTNPEDLAAQGGDSARALDPMVITAERSPSTLHSSTSSVTRIDAAQLARLPHATVADVVRLTPGFALVDFDGLGFDPQLMVRGFYGGGEAEYVVVMIDGQPVSQLQSGLVGWETLPPLETVDAIEIIRGSSSALYGDAAVGAVINIITRTPATRVHPWSVSRGSYDTWRATGGVGGDFLWRDASLAAELRRTRGFRDHAERTMGRADAEIVLASTAARRVALTTRGHWREFDDPGPLLDSLHSRNRSQSDPFFRFDGMRDRGYALRVHGNGFDGRTRTSGSIGGERRVTEAIRTIALSPDVADTKARDLTTTSATASVQAGMADTPLPGRDELVLGVDASRGWMTSTYFQVASGTRAEYAALSGLPEVPAPAPPSQPGTVDAAGQASRSAAALFAQYAVHVLPAVRLSLGSRFDWLWDDFTPRSPSEGPTESASHSAFSPKAGLNVRFLETGAHTGNIFLTASRSFKAPTLDQLFDQRSIPVPFPPFTITTSNGGLEPQYGVNLEAGLYQRASVGEHAMLAATLSAYQMDMKNELDFDVATLRYVNIGRSRHRGMEAGLTLTGLGSAALWLNHTVQSARVRSGDFSGNLLKAIPEHVTTAGASLSPRSALDVRALVSSSRGIFLDDANTVALPSYTRVDAAVAYRLRSIEVFVDVRNLVGTRYSTTGFLDPSGSGAAYFYPAAGRVMQLGIRGGS
jgi:outer membrane receptor protein involved in Fe transport